MLHGSKRPPASSSSGDSSCPSSPRALHRSCRLPRIAALALVMAVSSLPQQQQMRLLSTVVCEDADAAVCVNDALATVNGFNGPIYKATVL